jgi:2-keto-4-pentenoate hydratase/2-oxohepta-3-ene-1,7-dioic acid hydratase in catechol pathway
VSSSSSLYAKPRKAEFPARKEYIVTNERHKQAELKLAIPSTPTVFLKANTCLNSPSGRIYYPHPGGHHDCLLDYEVELAVVIAKTCKDVSEDEAMQYVLGYMTANDVTSRRHQQEVSQWDHGKGFDGFCPIGPTLVSSQAIPDPSVLRLRTVLNGKVMQDGKARDMIFSVAKIVSFLSQVRNAILCLCLRCRRTGNSLTLRSKGMHIAAGYHHPHRHAVWDRNKPRSGCLSF